MATPLDGTVAESLAAIPAETIGWLTEPDNPAVAVLTRQRLLGEQRSAELDALWTRRNEYGPVARILGLQQADGAWAPPARDYQKYWGSLWQIHFLGELWANPADERVQRAAEYAFSRQLPSGAWSCNGRPVASIPCLTANVGRALARLGFERDGRVVRALAWCAGMLREFGCIACAGGAHTGTLNGYCHMVAPKLLLFLGEVPRDAWPEGAEELRDECVRVLRAREIYRCLPEGYREFQEAAMHVPVAERPELRNRWIAEHGELVYGEKSGWLRFGFPLSYNSDALEALSALVGVGEAMRPEYAEAVRVVRSAANGQMRWTLKTTFNGKMLADVEEKGQPSKWLTLRALEVLRWAEGR
ncbi:MAG: hypothetical protein AB2L09_09785 [Coriobacteriia bacterium]